MSESIADPITVRAPRELLARLDAIGAATERDRSHLIRRAIEQFVEANTWQIERIQSGLADLRAGRTRSADDVFAAIAGKHGFQP